MLKRWLDYLITISFGLFAYFLTYYAGSRGFYAFDQSIVFDGSYRVVSGQIPYKDFMMPFGPVTFALQALYFELLGVSYHSYLVGSASIGFFATMVSACIIRSLVKGKKLPLVVAVAITSVWFYAPFGTPWVDQTGFFFSLLAIWFGVLSVKGHSRQSSIYSLFCGLLWLAVFLSKQNIGSFIFFLFPLLFLGTKGKKGIRNLLFFFFGIFSGSVGFLIWLSLCSDFWVFLRCFFLLPGRLGSERLSSLVKIGLGLLAPYFDGRGSVFANAITIICFVTGIMGLRFLRRRRLVNIDQRKAFVASSILCVYIPVFQHIFINTTLNQADNGFALLGTCFGIALGLLTGSQEVSTLDRKRLGGESVTILPTGSKRGKIIFSAAIAILVALSTVSGIKVSLERRVHDIFEHASFEEEIAIEKFKPLRWGKITAMGGYEITEESIVSLYMYLSKSGLRFFIFPDFTIFYGLLNVPSPQPLLWFHEGVTFSAKNNQWLDRKIKESLEKAQIQIFILEQVSWFNTGKRLDRFPETKAYLFANFTPIERIGTFLVYRRKQVSM